MSNMHKLKPLPGRRFNLIGVDFAKVEGSVATAMLGDISHMETLAEKRHQRNSHARQDAGMNLSGKAVQWSHGFRRLIGHHHMDHLAFQAMGFRLARSNGPRKDREMQFSYGEDPGPRALYQSNNALVLGMENKWPRLIKSVVIRGHLALVTLWTKAWVMVQVEQGDYAPSVEYVTHTVHNLMTPMLQGLAGTTPFTATQGKILKTARAVNKSTTLGAAYNVAGSPTGRAAFAAGRQVGKTRAMEQQRKAAEAMGMKVKTIRPKKR